MFLLNNKKSAQKVCSKDMVYEETFRLSSRTQLGRSLTSLSKTTNIKNIDCDEAQYDFTCALFNLKKD